MESQKIIKESFLCRGSRIRHQKLSLVSNWTVRVFFIDTEKGNNKNAGKIRRVGSRRKGKDFVEYTRGFTPNKIGEGK